MNGPNEEPLYTFLKNISSEGADVKDIEWNFTKFLFNKNLELFKRYDPRVEPSIWWQIYNQFYKLNSMKNIHDITVKDVRLNETLALRL